MTRGSRGAWLAAVFTAAAAMPSPAAESDAPQERLPQAAMSLLNLYAAKGGAASAASAIMVAPGRVITNCHVLGKALRAAVARAGEGVGAELVAADHRRDLCLLRNDALRAAVARIAPADSVSVGDPVFAVGFTAGRFAFSEGTVEAVYAMDGGHVIRTTAGFSAGASGGGLFDRDGRLVGLLTFYRHGAGGSAYFAVPAQWVSDLLAHGDRLPHADDQAPPFWSPEARDPPAFLTAFALEADGNWAELERFARRWLLAEPDSADARAALRTARERQREPQPAGASERR